MNPISGQQFPHSSMEPEVAHGAGQPGTSVDKRKLDAAFPEGDTALQRNPTLAELAGPRQSSNSPGFQRPIHRPQERDEGPASAGQGEGSPPYAKAALVLTRALRKRTADRIQAEMLKAGDRWYTELQSDEKVTVAGISAENIGDLKRDFPLAGLAPHEAAFLGKLLDEPLYITHATSSQADIDRPDGSVTLFSRKKLLERNIEFALENTSERDRSALANDDHVFFSLEAGDTPQKPSSRFGNRLLRFPFDQPQVLDHATLHLVDPLSAAAPMVGERLSAISDHADVEAACDAIQALEERNFVPAQTMFRGQDMKLGLALSVIKACRNHMPVDMARPLLENESVNDIINGLFRPTVMVPRHFFGKPFDEASIDNA